MYASPIAPVRHQHGASLIPLAAGISLHTPHISAPASANSGRSAQRRQASQHSGRAQPGSCVQCISSSLLVGVPALAHGA